MEKEFLDHVVDYIVLVEFKFIPLENMHKSCEHIDIKS